jgi:iron complex outermembrane receptor protein
LEDYSVQQHKVEFTSPDLVVRSYFTTENTGRSYNLRPLGENLDRAYKSDNVWFADYTAAWNNALAQGNNIEESHRLARITADSGRYLPGTPEFEAKKAELAAINNWDKGAALVMKNSLLHNEIQYSFSDSSLLHGLTAGVDQRTYLIEPDGNSFINPIDSGNTLYFSKFGGFIQFTREIFQKKLKLVLSIRADKATYFEPVINPRAALVYTVKNKHHFRFSWQTGYRYPTLFEAFSYVDNGGVRRIGGLPLMSQQDQIFENSYTRSSVDKYVAAVNADINAGFSQQDAITRNENLLVKSEYTYIRPEKINTFEIGYKALLFHDRVLFDADAYFNRYDHFIGQVEVVKPNSGSIGVDDSTTWYAYDRTKNKKYRMWTNSLGTVTNHGASIGITWSVNRKYTLSGNFAYSDITGIKGEDALIPAFNTPRYTVNLTAGNRAITERLGASVTWRWQDGFFWQSPLADGYIPAYQTVDVQLTLQLPKIHSHIKAGATNVLNHRFTQYTGGPRIGGFYYVSFLYDHPLELFKKKQ